MQYRSLFSPVFFHASRAAQQPQESEKPEASQTPEATDKPQATQKPEQVPQTGDASQLTAMVGVLLTSATALGGLTMARKRRNG